MSKPILTLRNKINSHTLTIGSWITLGHPAIAEIMAKAGFDWLAVDLEHSTITIDQAGELIRIIDLCGVSPLVRLTSNNMDQIKRVMDAGAHGIIVPMVNSVEDAAKAVAAVHYAPNGMRGVGLARAQGYGASFPEYLEWQKNNPIVIIQIEHKDALDKLEEIFSVPGVDGFIIGPYDLSCSLGIPGQFKDSQFIAVMDQIRDTSKRFKIAAGVHIVEPNREQLIQAIKTGYQFIGYSVDIRLLDVGSREGIESLKNFKK